MTLRITILGVAVLDVRLGRLDDGETGPVAVLTSDTLPATDFGFYEDRGGPTR